MCIRDRIRIELNLNLDHRPHDGRKHFVTMAKKDVYKRQHHHTRFFIKEDSVSLIIPVFKLFSYVFATSLSKSNYLFMNNTRCV